MFESIQKFWVETMELPGAGWIVGIFGLVVCVLVAYYFVKLFRDMAIGQRSASVSHLAEFQRLHEEGLLNDQEYKKLKTTIPKNRVAPVIPKTEPGLPKEKDKKADLGDTNSETNSPSAADFQELAPDDNETENESDS